MTKRRQNRPVDVQKKFKLKANQVTVLILKLFRSYPHLISKYSIN